MFRVVYDWNLENYILNGNLINNINKIFLNFYKLIYLTTYITPFSIFKQINLIKNFGNISVDIISINFLELMITKKLSITNSLDIIFTQYTYYYEFYYFLNLNNIITYTNSIVNFFSTNIYYIINLIFIIILSYIYIYFLQNENISIIEKNRNSFILLYEEIILSWTRFTGIKFESYEEALSIIIIWPWCIFLIFSHIFNLENNEIFFIFIEWGLPIVYGYLIIIESMVLFSKYFFLYLNGARGRKFLLITILEDFIAFIILLSRVTLQAVRGLICGLYHDFFREITVYLLDTLINYRFEKQWFNSYSLNFTSIFLINIICLLYITSFTLAFIYVLLFLQILFLLIAVWLFCRCWFISTKSTICKYKKYQFNNNREINLKKKLKTFIL